MFERKTMTRISAFILFYVIILNNIVHSETIKPWWSQEITECDIEASHRLDPYHVAPGVLQKNMNFIKAEKACLEALKEDPDNPRLNYQMGRVYGYSGQWEKGMPYRMKAVEAEYPQSLFVIGWLYLTGNTINEKNPCKTFSMWKRSAELGRLAAQIALPRHYLLGDFDQCGGTLTNTQMNEFLDNASKQDPNYYASMLIEDLKLKIYSK
tara:strand:+ start:200 stop:829 length:630 start_codon:yes stop_codon:yes gene_type:complete